ncbi:MAG: anthrone oxygenase family protein [Henriciella sp.]|uniref:anthrone oxygenase family protein n=1 Tax=Henriciella sp. TaxID=1968823 RepID=UPI003C76D3EB
MMHDWPLYFCLFLALWSAVIGGVFSAFSEFIMAGLLRTAPSGGIEAMQHINRTVIRTQFVAGILLIAPLSVLFAIYGLSAFEGPARSLLVLAPIVYLPTVFLMTMFGNVPMNNKLERLDHTSAEAKAYWAKYGRDWTRLNHIRSVGSIVTALLYIMAAVTLAANADTDRDHNLANAISIEEGHPDSWRLKLAPQEQFCHRVVSAIGHADAYG